MKKEIVGLAMLLSICLAGCGKIAYPVLPDDPIAFTMGEFVDNEHDDALFGTIEYNGRTYIPYGTTNSSYDQKSIDKCIGYLIMDDNSTAVSDSDNKNTRIYTVSEDSDNNFLMEYDETIELMNQPSFYRALDTKGIDIKIPKFIDASGYEFWG